ncbi:MAG: hypothetical protein GZ087_15605 [Flavobacterium sp.]|nr:hypothetical protein [Flavobacterium sp.]
MRIQTIPIKKFFFLLFIGYLISSCNNNEGDTIIPSTDKLTLFNLTDLPEIKLTIPLKDWNTLLTNYDLNSQNDKKVVSSFLFQLNGKTIKLDSIGLRLKGNTSRRRPEGNFGETHNTLSPDWHHCHFGLDFNKFNPLGAIILRKK